MRFKPFCIAITVCLAAASCASGPGTQNNVPAAASSEYQEPETADESQTPDKILVSKGVIKSDNEIPVYSRITGQLNAVKLIDGQTVHKGDVLFTLDDEELTAKVVLCEAELEQARLLMEEILVGQGYKKAELDNVPANIVSLARIKSGCNVKEEELEIARKRLSNAVIKAPLSGVLSGLTHTSFAYVNPGETLCKIVDTKSLIVEFYILETELRRFQMGSVIQVSSIAYSEVQHSAIVRSIGSVVDEAGMIKVEAELQDTENLMPGMTAIVKL